MFPFKIKSSHDVLKRKNMALCVGGGVGKGGGGGGGWSGGRAVKFIHKS